MYICICNNVTDKDIKNLVNSNISSIEDIQKITNAGNRCGKCIHTLKGVIMEYKEENKSMLIHTVSI